jgi:vacuolar-type H+-ATPase subunit H
MEKTVSPLQIIHEKEAELQRRLEEVRRQAEVKIQSAYAEAKQTIARGDQEGRAEAEAVYQQGIKQARQEAEAILTTAHEEVAAMYDQTKARLDAATELIMKLALPLDLPPT